MRNMVEKSKENNLNNFILNYFYNFYTRLQFTQQMDICDVFNRVGNLLNRFATGGNIVLFFQLKK